MSTRHPAPSQPRPRSPGAGSLRLPDDPADAGELAAFLDRAVAAGEAARPAAAAPLDVDRLAGIDALIACVDLTCLDADVTDAALDALCQQAVRPDPGDPGCPPVAAVCSWPDAVPAVRAALAGTAVAVCAVAGGFPNGRQPAWVVAADVAGARAAGADEIDVPLHRGLLAAGADADVLARVRAAVDAAGGAPVKVILETAALSPAAARRAAWIAALGGAAWLKTSTGQLAGGASVEAVAVLADVAVAAGELTGRPVGVKASGGVRTVAHAGAMADAAAAAGAVRPDRLRLGASSLLDALVARRRELAPAGGAARRRSG